MLPLSKIPVTIALCLLVTPVFAISSERILDVANVIVVAPALSSGAARANEILAKMDDELKEAGSDVPTEVIKGFMAARDIITTCRASRHPEQCGQLLVKGAKKHALAPITR